MFYFALGLVTGVFLPVHYNIIIKDSIFAAWEWIKSGPRA